MGTMESLKNALRKFICLLSVVGVSTCQGDGRFFPVCSGYCGHFYLNIEGGYRWLFDIPEYDYGFQGAAAALPTPVAGPLLFTSKNPRGSYFAPSLGVSVPLCGCHCLVPDALSVDILGNFFYASEKKEFNFTNPNTMALVFGTSFIVAVAPTNVQDGRVVSRFRFNTGQVDIAPRYAFRVGCSPLMVEPILSYAYNRFIQTFDTSARFPVLGNMTISIYQELATFYNDLGGGVRFVYSPWCNINLFMKNAFYYSWAESHLHSGYFRNQPVTAFYTPDQKREVSSWAYKGSLGIDYYLCRLHLGVVTNYEYRNYLPAVLNPQILAIGGGALIQNTALIVRTNSLHSLSIGGYGGWNF